MSPSPWRLVERDTGAVVVESLEIADTYWSRLKGLQFRRALAPNAGLLIVPCSSIHTFWVRFPIDVVFLSDRGEVLEICPRVRPWRVLLTRRSAHAVLEVVGGAWTTQPGARLQLEALSGSGAAAPASVAFLRPGPDS